jgi:hypothetical protein
MLGNLRISIKLLITVGLAVLGIAAVAGPGAHDPQGETCSRSSSVEEQAAVTADIARNGNDVMTDMDKIGNSIGGITRASVLTCGGAIEVLWASEDLGATARSLKADAADFVSHIRG